MKPVCLCGCHNCQPALGSFENRVLMHLFYWYCVYLWKISDLMAKYTIKLFDQGIEHLDTLVKGSDPIND